VTAGHHRDLGGSAPDVHDERTGNVGGADAGPRRGGDRLFDELHVAPRLDRPRGHREGSLFDPRGAARDADHGQRPQQATAQAGPAQERLQHGYRRVQVGDDPITQRVDDIDAPGILPSQSVRCVPHRRHAASGLVDGDRGWLIDHEPPPGDVDQRVDRSQIDCHARPQPHATFSVVQNCLVWFLPMVPSPVARS
jgi:hypothetical protein